MSFTNLKNRMNLAADVCNRSPLGGAVKGLVPAFKEAAIAFEDAEALLAQNLLMDGLLSEAYDVISAAIDSGDWEVDGVNDPDLLLKRINALPLVNSIRAPSAGGNL